MSIVVVPPPASRTASSAELPDGSARNATSMPGSGSPSTSVRPSGARCGNSSASGDPSRPRA